MTNQAGLIAQVESIAKNVYISELGYAVTDVTQENIYLVWFSKTLQNWKALVSGKNVGEYLEITHNGDKGETYIDVYLKRMNVVIKDGEDYASLEG